MVSKWFAIRTGGAIALTLLVTGCDRGDERLAERATVEGRASAEAGLAAQLAAQDQLIEQAKNEGKAAAEAELQTQMENIDLIVAKAQAEGKAAAQADFQVQMDNLDLLLLKAETEGKAVAQAELQTQIENIGLVEQMARAEGRAVALAELQAQAENLDLLVARARAEGRAAAEADLLVSNGSLVAKAQEMEVDLTTRHLFYQAVRGTYEGKLSTEKGVFRIRITLVPSLAPYLSKRTRQLEEITSDLNNLSFHAQVLQWNPINNLSSVGCRVENIRPDTNRGEIAIASSNCPNLYKLRIADSILEETLIAESTLPLSKRQLSTATAEAIRAGKVSELPEMRGEVHPTTNASIYSLIVNRSSER